MVNSIIESLIFELRLNLNIIINTRYIQNIMKADVYEEFVSPDILELKKVEKPTPKDDEGKLEK